MRRKIETMYFSVSRYDPYKDDSRYEIYDIEDERLVRGKIGDDNMVAPKKPRMP